MKRRTIAEQEEELQAEQYTATATTNDTKKHDADTATADRIFAKALTDLSLNDRTAIEDEIHGVSCMAIEETPHLLEHSLIDFESELHKINPKPAYDRAQQLLLESYRESSRCYINEKNFRLRFLRCELFDVRKAAKRFIRYLDFIAEVYGEYALQRPICMDDFNREEMSFLKKGECQLLPYRDRSGRKIIYDCIDDRVPIHTFLKVIFYLLNACIDSSDTTNNDFNNIECLRKGLIIVSCVPSNSYIASTESNKEIQRVRLSSKARVTKIVPIRLACVHMCYPNTQMYRFNGRVFGLVASFLNSRTKIHLGNPVEWRYALRTYGIPTEILPVSNTGTIKLDNLKQWIKLKKYTDEQEMIEMTASTKTLMEAPMYSIVECPGSNDVVFRMGKSMDYHPGNIKFQNVIESQLQYHSDPNTTKAQKDAIVIEVIQHIKKDGGRFLKWESDNGWWSNMSVEMCVDMDLDIDMNSGNTMTTNSISPSAKINTKTDTNSNKNTNENMNMKVKGNENVNVSLNSRTNSVEYFKAEKEIQSKVNFAFRHFKKRMIRAQQKQQQLQVSASSTYVFEQQDGQKRRRSNNSDSATTIMGSNTNSGNNSNICMPFLPDMNGNACGYFFSSANGSSYDYNSI